MKSIKRIILYSGLFLFVISVGACVNKTQSTNKVINSANGVKRGAAVSDSSQGPVSLPVGYQTARYVVDRPDDKDLTFQKQSRLKVGARITSTKGPQPLWSVLKRLAALKRMSIIWGTDVDQNMPVNVDINAKDDFEDAINNLLSQTGYFAEFQKNTIAVRNKITKQYRVSMPFITQEYSTETGGDIISGGGTKNGFTALIKLKAHGSTVGTSAFGKKGTKTEFDIWDNIDTNLKVMLNILESSEVMTSVYEKEFGAKSSGRSTGKGAILGDGALGRGVASDGSFKGGTDQKENTDTQKKSQKVKATRMTSRDGSYFIIDKPVGIITVTTTKEMHKRIKNYIDSLNKALYTQVTIEAKIIEVNLSDESNIGINWSKVLKNFGMTGSVGFGDHGKVYPFVYNNDAVSGPITYTDATRRSYFKTINPGQFISNITFASRGFDLFLNALNEQGDARVLSNPKISVLNGQPAFITVGRNIAYIDAIEAKVSDFGNIAYTVKTDHILSGLGMALTATVLDNTHVIMNLVPVVSNLKEPIEYRDIGPDGATVGLPVVNIREMNTTVKVADGEMLVIGGLISDTSESNGEFAPLFGDIPIVKYLFGYESKTHRKRELIILLKPRII